MDELSSVASDRARDPMKRFLVLLICLLPCVVLGDELTDGDAALQRGDYATAVKALTELAEKGQARAQIQLGSLYLVGQGVPEDLKQALFWFRKAAEQGNPTAQLTMGVMYYTGRGVPQDYKQTVDWYRKAAEQGFASAQLLLGRMYATGQGIPQDYKQALEWYRRAAEQSDGEAQFCLGWMYEKGRGILRDRTQALSWYRKGAELGNAAAQFKLGELYYSGVDVLQDWKEAFDWYRKAAQQGNVLAQLKLGQMYENGQGIVPHDYAQGYFWLSLAAASGNERARKYRDALAQKMTPQESGRGRDLVEEWKRRASEASSTPAENDILPSPPGEGDKIET
jgi:TPR repeat protein